MNYNMDLFILIILITLTGVISETLPCGPHSISHHRYHFEGNCYVTFKSMFDHVTWQSAEYKCVELGGHLVSIHSQNESEFLKDHITTQELWLKDNFWIGLRSSSGSPFAWSDGTIVDYTELTYNAFDGLNSPTDDKCVFIAKGRWTETNCVSGYFHDYSYICKIVPPTQDISNDKQVVKLLDGECMDGWTKQENWCRKAFGFDKKERLKFTSAYKHCKLFHSEGSLATIYNELDQVEVTSLLQGLDANPWIGMKRLVGEFRWTDYTKLSGYTNWDVGEPLVSTPVLDSRFQYPQVEKKLCISASVNKFKPGKWKTNSDCETPQPFVCQTLLDNALKKPAKSDNSACGDNTDGYNRFGNTCYKLYDSVSDYKAWTEAEEYCVQDGGQLASILDGFQQAFVQTLTWRASSPVVWIGLQQDVTDKYVFQWQKNESLPFGYENWENGQPTNNHGQCAVVLERIKGKWAVSTVTLKTAFLCEKTVVAGKEIQIVTTTETALSANLVCPFSEEVTWIDVGTEYCFYLVNHKEATWEDGQEFCEFSGTTLAKLSSDSELSLLRTELQQKGITYEFWIGFYENEAQIRWSDQTPFNSQLEKKEQTSHCMTINDPDIFVQCIIDSLAIDKTPLCGVMNPIKSSFVLRNCSEPRHFLCRVQKVEASNETSFKIETSSQMTVTTSTTQRLITPTTISTKPTPTQTTSKSSTRLPDGIETTPNTKFVISDRKEKLVVNKLESKKELSSSGLTTTLVVLAIGSLVIAGIVVIVYRRKKRTRMDNGNLSFSNNLFENSDGSTLSLTKHGV